MTSIFTPNSDTDLGKYVCQDDDGIVHVFYIGLVDDQPGIFIRMWKDPGDAGRSEYIQSKALYTMFKKLIVQGKKEYETRFQEPAARAQMG